MDPLRFVVYSDYICPWCYNVSVRLQRLEDEYEGRVAFAWRSYLLRPNPSPRGRDLKKFRAYTKSWLRPDAEEDSGEFRVWASDEPPPAYSVPPHLVAKAAARLGPDAFRKMHDRLLRAYFGENLDITDTDRLRALWDEVGLDPEAFETSRDPALLEATIDEYNEALEIGATGVPAVRPDGSPAVIVGAHPISLYRRWIERLLANPL